MWKSSRVFVRENQYFKETNDECWESVEECASWISSADWILKIALWRNLHGIMQHVCFGYVFGVFAII